MITEEMIRVGRKTAVGSIVCTQKIIEDNITTLFYHSAIRMTNEEFTPNGEGERNYHSLDRFFSQLDTRMDSLFRYKGASYVEDYGVFSFSATEGWTCLADLPLPLSPEIALSIFKVLLETIDAYSQFDMNDISYKPLLFICRESVYVKFDKNGALEKVRLLPMLYDPQTMYEGMPREVAHKKADISSDVFMAAYLYLLLKHTDEKPFDEAIFTNCDLLAEQCLSPFKLRRPTLQQVLSVINDGEKVIKEDKSNDAPGTDYSFTVVVEEDAVVAQKKTKRDVFGISKLKGNSKNTGFKNIISKAKGKLGEMLSTEKADETEDQ